MENDDFLRCAFAGLTPEQRAEEIGATLWPASNYDARFIQAAKEMLARHIQYAITEDRKTCRDLAIEAWKVYEGVPGNKVVTMHLVVLRAIVDAAIRAIVTEEREACAKEAESKCETWKEEGDGESVMASQSLYGMADAGRAIAIAIRARGTP